MDLNFKCTCYLIVVIFEKFRTFIKTMMCKNALTKTNELELKHYDGQYFWKNNTIYKKKKK